MRLWFVDCGVIQSIPWKHMEAHGSNGVTH
jgi:hypothetical protein